MFVHTASYSYLAVHVPFFAFYSLLLLSISENGVLYMHMIVHVLLD